MSSVAVAIDGVSYGNAAYGGYRPDVCCSSSDGPNCPYTGWSINIDTALLAGGAHTFKVTFTTADGRQTTGSRTFNVQQAILYDAIDVPNSSTTYVGAQNFGGWARDLAFPISSVAVAIDGVSRGNASYGGYRPDVCSSASDGPNCPNTGWNFGINTAQLGAGTHTLTATVTTTDGRQTSGSRAFTVQAPTAWVAVEAPAAQQSYSGNVAFGGWALDNLAAIRSVAVSIDGAGFGQAAYGGSRQDVCNVYPNGVGCPNVGWSFGLNTARLPNGQHTFVATVTTTDSRVTTNSVTFSTSNANPTTEWIDAPQSGNSYSGTQTFNGWAVDSVSAIASVSVAIDGKSYGNANYGTSRSDVCAVYPNSVGCPNVGLAACKQGLDSTNS